MGLEESTEYALNLTREPNRSCLLASETQESQLIMPQKPSWHTEMLEMSVSEKPLVVVVPRPPHKEQVHLGFFHCWWETAKLKFYSLHM